MFTAKNTSKETFGDAAWRNTKETTNKEENKEKPQRKQA